MKVLGIETSCDETAAGVVDETGVLSDIIWSQQIHEDFGGVVPELASRAHIEKVVTCTQAALDKANIARPELVCATAGPGLIGAVLVGFTFAKALAIGYGVPFIGVNHLEGHLLSCLLEERRPKFPFLSLVVSGGHTTLYLAKNIGEYLILGQTIDDAAGEAYDKVSRMLGMGYPGGPVVDALAKQGQANIPFPRANNLAKGKTRVDNAYRSELDISFSGLKTAVRQYLEKNPGWNPPDVAASFQQAVIDVLVDRITRAIKMTGVQQVAIGGGVAANSALRQALEQLSGVDVFLPPKNRCTDNASMIASVGRLRYLHGYRSSMADTARSRWPVDEVWQKIDGNN